MNTDPTNQNQTTPPNTTGGITPNQQSPTPAETLSRTTQQMGGASSVRPPAAPTSPSAQKLSHKPIIPQDISQQAQTASQISTPTTQTSPQPHTTATTAQTQTPSNTPTEPLTGKKTMPRPQSILHTYKGDVEDLVKKQKLSLMQMAAAQADAPKKQLHKLNPDKTKKRRSPSINVPLIAGALTLLGFVALFVSYSVFFVEPPAPPVQKGEQYRFFFTDKSETVDISDKAPEALKRVLASMRASAFYPKGTIVQVIPVTISTDEAGQSILQPVTAQEWFELLALSLPQKYYSAFAQPFMFGWYADGTQNHPYLALKVLDYDTAFAAFFEWEPAIEVDFFPVFTLNPAHPAERYSMQEQFVDTVIDNIDVRLLKGPDGKVRLLYGFPKKDILLLTTDVVPFVEIARRLRSAP